MGNVILEWISLRLCKWILTNKPNVWGGSTKILRGWGEWWALFISAFQNSPWIVIHQEIQAWVTFQSCQICPSLPLWVSHHSPWGSEQKHRRWLWLLQNHLSFLLSFQPTFPQLQINHSMGWANDTWLVPRTNRTGWIDGPQAIPPKKIKLDY